MRIEDRVTVIHWFRDEYGLEDSEAKALNELRARDLAAMVEIYYPGGMARFPFVSKSEVAA
jgi:hypothetical protein